MFQFCLRCDGNLCEPPIKTVQDWNAKRWRVLSSWKSHLFSPRLPFAVFSNSGILWNLSCSGFHCICHMSSCFQQWWKGTFTAIVLDIWWTAGFSERGLFSYIIANVQGSRLWIDLKWILQLFITEGLSFEAIFLQILVCWSVPFRAEVVHSPARLSLHLFCIKYPVYSIKQF